MKKLILIMVMVLSLGIVGCSATVEGEKNLENKMWIEDIGYLDKELRENHPDLFRYTTEEIWTENIENLKKDIKHLSDQDIVLRIAQLVSSVQDLHTAIDILDLLTPIKEEKIESGNIVELPIRCEYFEDGLRVVKCSSDYKEVLGYKLLSINGIDIDEVIERLSSLTFHDNEQLAKEIAKRYMAIYEFLRFLEIVESEEAEYVFEDEDKNKISLNIEAKKNKDVNYIELEHKELKTEQKPQNESDFYWFNYFEEDKILYLQHNIILSSNSWIQQSKDGEQNPDYFEFLTRLIDEINGIELDKLVIDLRKNPGGDMSIVNDLIEQLKYKTNLRDDDIVVMTGKATSSASVQLTFSLQETLGATVIGEETGGNINFFAMEGDIIVLPNSKLSIVHPRHIINNSSDHMGGVEPDIELIQSYEDYINGVDTCYEYVRSMIK